MFLTNVTTITAVTIVTTVIYIYIYIYIFFLKVFQYFFKEQFETFDN